MNKMIIKIILSSLFIFMVQLAYADKPLVGVFSYDTSSPRSFTIIKFLETHFENIIYTTGVFDSLKTQQLKGELKKFACVDEKCLLREFFSEYNYFSNFESVSSVVRSYFDIGSRGRWFESNSLLLAVIAQWKSAKRSPCVCSLADS